MITEAVVTLPISTKSLKCTDLSLRITASEYELIAISAVLDDSITETDKSQTSDIIELTKKLLQEYLNGERRSFEIPICINQGTDFQRKVWTALRDIPFGQTRTYGEIAKQIGSPKGARAVGMACNKNPLLIITPCHRVIGATGSLTGFACGLDIKKTLLEIEK